MIISRNVVTIRDIAHKICNIVVYTWYSQTMNQKHNKLMVMIQKNLKLAMIKSDVILGKIYET